jgi:hypothetical protein
MDPLDAKDGGLLRNAVNQASNAYGQATDTAGTLGTEAQGIGANLTPFLTGEIEHPQGYSQQDQSGMLSAALGGAGGATSGITGLGNERAAASGNAGGLTAALDQAARSRGQAGAMGAENIAAKNAGVKQEEMQSGAKGLEDLYGADTSGMLNAMNQEHGDINSEVDASKTGWAQNLEQGIDTGANLYKALFPKGVNG